MPRDNSTVTIKISGPPGCGKTSIGLLIEKLLKGKGLDASLVQDELNELGFAAKVKNLSRSITAIKKAKTKIVIDDRCLFHRKVATKS